MNYLKPIIVAEIGCNHQGDINLAKKLIIQAKIAGATYAKFQKKEIINIYWETNFQIHILFRKLFLGLRMANIESLGI